MACRTTGRDNPIGRMDAGQQVGIRVTGRAIWICGNKIAVIWHMQVSIIIMTVQTGDSDTTGNDISYCLTRCGRIVCARNRRGREMAG